MPENPAARRQRALVFGGGGSRGALQAGASRALFERGYAPDLLVGTSAGAINAAFLALRGVSQGSLDAMDRAWREAGQQDLLPANYVWLTLRSMLRPSSPNPASRIREFFVANGIEPGLRFADLRGPRLIVVSTDLNTGKPVLHGERLEDEVLEALLTSTALPPWSMPVKKQDRYLMDGAVVSSLPIEAALDAGASDIVALDLADPREPLGPVNGFGGLLNQLAYAVEHRQVDLELALARARGVPVLYLPLRGAELVRIWDFSHTEELITLGYQITKSMLIEQAAVNALSSLWTEQSHHL